ncbi:Gfo/Idh/MocA family oxidoreductase [uncultured Jannaschia sp.]|uniref:Gfo/Idh/MocA family protein n=1 Tax=uncultured Jannaschia sp. TaxID=293347 RepID=UPI002639AD6A|nr:Gfo/Idh/MocA family oxidoreductase [uncultured Jannaschia sp.]
MTIRYGLIGAGMMGQEHIRNIALLDGVAITAIADPDDTMRDAARQLQGGIARAFADWRDMLSADLCDAYVIASPNDAHYETLQMLLRVEKPILCEKPLCTTLDHCREIAALQATRRAPLLVGMEYRYMPPVQRLLDTVQAGTIGRPIMLSIREHRFPFLPKVGGWNRFARRTGGTLVEKCCHFWDLMRLMLRSDPIRVYASAGCDINHLDRIYEGESSDMTDNAFVILDFANGTRGMLDLCMFAEGSRWQEVITLTGPKGSVEARIPGPPRFFRGELPESEVALSDRASGIERVSTIPIDPAILAAGDHHGATYYQHVRFADLVRRGHGPAEVDASDGVWSVLVGAAAEESARTGRAIELVPLG